jgi:hypothetical protein
LLSETKWDIIVLLLWSLKYIGSMSDMLLLLSTHHLSLSFWTHTSIYWFRCLLLKRVEVFRQLGCRVKRIIISSICSTFWLSVYFDVVSHTLIHLCHFRLLGLRVIPYYDFTLRLFFLLRSLLSRCLFTFTSSAICRRSCIDSVHWSVCLPALPCFLSHLTSFPRGYYFLDT